MWKCQNELILRLKKSVLVSSTYHYSKPSYMSQKIFGSDLFAMRKTKVTLSLNKPSYVGMCILDFSKILMYEFRYDHIKSNYGSNSIIIIIIIIIFH